MGDLDEYELVMTEREAWEAAKVALQSAPVLGHPIEGKPYRLYTDASDLALGCCLQQVQPIALRDLKGTKVYSRLQHLYNSGKLPLQLVTKLSSKIDDVSAVGGWANAFDDTVVHVERVLGYWSRTFKDAETRYSATEREALAAKEGLVHFQPFIKGEQVTLVTDYAALQWAKTYENANKRLAAWGAVYSAYLPGLDIVHRPGRVHSNVDPLFRLIRAPPNAISPATDPYQPLRLNDDAAEEVERAADAAPAARASFVASEWGDIVDIRNCAAATRRSSSTTASRPRSSR